MPDTVRHPDTGTEIPERRRSLGRRAHDRVDYEGRFGIAPAFWAIIGSLVVLYLFFVALGGVDPDDAPAASIVALVLGIVWLAHAWRRVIVGGISPQRDRERRGF